jgi:hypothetical protein
LQGLRDFLTVGDQFAQRFGFGGSTHLTTVFIGSSAEKQYQSVVLPGVCELPDRAMSRLETFAPDDR